MPCEHYEDALIEAAATGAPPQGELRAHLNGCASCRAAFEQEQSLFAAIDSGLRISANSEVPASLLPRVRAHLDEEAGVHRGWFTNWLVLAGAAVVVIALFVFSALWRTNVGQPTGQSTANNVTSPPIAARPPRPLAAQPSPGGNLPSRPHAARPTGSTPPGTSAGRSAMPEVLVPRDQELLLTSYAQRWLVRKRPPLAASGGNETAVAILEVAPIQIAQLDVKLLTEDGSK
jgi:hypothetical protein